jgi:RNA polymerase sigma factor (sigma-70 family)
VAAREEMTALDSALSRLPENYRRVLHLRYQEKQSFAKIGEALSCSAEAARKLWARAVIHLRALLEASP